MKKRLSVTILVVFLLTLCVGGYLGDYYRAEAVAQECIANPAEGIDVYEENNMLVFAPENATAGFIFYPGGKVAYEAYAPLMSACAENGILCVLVEMPGNLAVLDMNAADGIQERFPEVATWYIGGHSLGGSMAASYAEKNAEAYEGVILLASYSTADLSETELEVLSVYGTGDKVLNAEKYAEYKGNLPTDFMEIVIEGGCHAYFGAYGAQEGDGEPTITREEQTAVTLEAILNFK
ncbi:MAG: alpha/beta hydrolase [Roseburia sp.]|nr:alpha/beta hydrolase [Roseburia sp.]